MASQSGETGGVEVTGGAGVTLTSTDDLTSTTTTTASTTSTTTSTDTDVQTETSTTDTTTTTTTNSTLPPEPTVTDPPGGELATSPTLDPLPFLSSNTTSVPEYTTFITTVDGKPRTVTSALPTSLVAAPKDSTSGRTALIAGVTTAGVVILLALLLGIFIYAKKRLEAKKREEAQKKEVRSLLDGEDFDDDYNPPSGHMQQRIPLGAFPSPYTGQSSIYASSPTHSHLKTRVADSGSIFHEDIWPPPQSGGGLHDPIIARSSQINLSSVVDDIMGSPGPGALHPHGYIRNRESTVDTNASSVSRYSVVSTSSGVALMEPGLRRSPSPPYTDPFAPSRTSVYYGETPPSFGATSGAENSSTLDRTSRRVSSPTQRHTSPLLPGGTSRPTSFAKSQQDDSSIWLTRTLKGWKPS